MMALLRKLTGRPSTIDSPLAERVYLSRVDLFFGHAVGNMVMGMVGAATPLFYVMYSAGIPSQRLTAWYAGVFLASSAVAVIEHKFRHVTLDISNAPTWVARRILSGSVVAMAYGMAPFLLIGYQDLIAELFIFIILSTVVALGVTGYSIMPLYYFVIDAIILVPLTAFFFAKGDRFHLLLATIALLWQYVILKKGWVVSKSTINAIELNERLRQESEDHRRTKEKMEYLAYHDPLTGLANRRYFHEWVNKCLSRAGRAHTRIGFFVIDLNEFKVINDTLGHDVGDAVLAHVGNRLLASVREGDFVARLGGDEFCVVAENAGDGDDMDRLAEKLLAGLCGPVTLGGQELSIRASIGMSRFPDDGGDLTAVIKAADESMYDDKKRRKGGGA